VRERLSKGADAYGNGFLLSGECTSLVMQDLHHFLTSDAEEMPQSLKQLLKLAKSKVWLTAPIINILQLSSRGLPSTRRFSIAPGREAAHTGCVAQSFPLLVCSPSRAFVSGRSFEYFLAHTPNIAAGGSLNHRSLEGSWFAKSGKRCCWGAGIFRGDCKHSSGRKQGGFWRAQLE